METDIHTKMLHRAFCDSEYLDRMKSLPGQEMVPGDSDAASTLMAKAVALVAEGEPICIGLHDNNPLFILDPPVMGYYYGREPWELECTIDWLEELREVFGTMASNLRAIRNRMEANTA